MKITGKCKPKMSVMEEVYSIGYDYTELYLTKNILDEGSDIILNNCYKSDLKVTSVHTPHIGNDITDAREYIEQADNISNQLDATYLLHTSPFSTLSLSRFYKPDDVKSDSFCYENHPDVSSFILKNYFLDRGHPIALDNAHLYMAEENYIEKFEEIILEHDKNDIPIIHLADGTRIKDGLAFGEGNIDIEKTYKLLADNYNGKVVLEVPVSDRRDALEYIRRFNT